MAGGEVIGIGLLIAHVLLFGGVGYTFYQVRRSQKATDIEEAPQLAQTAIANPR